MKELIYRRTDTGYTIDRCPKDIPNAAMTFGSGYAMAGMPAGIDQSAIYYRQYRLGQEAVVVSTSYPDLFGSRKSGLADLLFAMGPGEAVALMESYPTANRYFIQKKQNYSQTRSSSVTWATLDVPLETFAGSTVGDLTAGCRVLKEAFGSPSLLSAMFHALLDVASDNPRMIVVFGPEEAHEALAERGRRIIESLFACLPVHVALHIGYLCPGETDEGNALFGIRYCARRSISDAVRAFTYVFDLLERQYSKPAHMADGVSSYAEMLSELVFRGDEASIRRIRELRQLLDSPALFGAQDVPKTIGQFYQLVIRNVSQPEMISLLDWRHDAIGKAQEMATLQRHPMWEKVEHWAYEAALHAMNDRRDRWGVDDPVFSQKRVDELFEDARRLRRMNAPTAEAWRELYAKYINNCVPLNDDRGQNLLRGYCDALKQARDTSFSGDFYWACVNDWVHQQWQSGALFENAEMVDAVRRLYALDASAAYRFAQTEADAVAGGATPRHIELRLGYDRYVFIQLLKKNPDAAASMMKKSLSGRDPFGDEATLQLYLQYMQLVSQNPITAQVFNEVCKACFEGKLASVDVAQTLDMLEDLDHPFVAACEKLNYSGQSKAALIERLKQLTKDDDIYSYYSKDPDMARRLARHLGGKWPKVVEEIDRVNHLRLEELGIEDFDEMVRFGRIGGEDIECQKYTRKLLWKKIESAFTGKAVQESLLAALALRNYSYSNYGRGMLSVQGIMADAEKLGISRNKVIGFCRKRADEDASDGLGYLSRVIKNGNDVSVPYPGETHFRKPDEDDWQEPSEGMPSLALLFAAPVCAMGFVICSLGLLSQIGLL